MQPDKINHNETLLSKPLITWILLAFACLTLPVALAQSNTVPDASAPEVTTSAQTNDSLHAQNIRKLLAIKEALEEKRARIRDLVEQLGNADEVDQEKLDRFFRLYPTLAEPAKGYGSGTVLVAIAPAGTRDIVWRGALQVFTNPEKMPVAERDQRMRWAAEKLLASIPGQP